MDDASGWLPPLVLFEQFDGDWPRYLNALYEIFSRDFVRNKPAFPGKRFGLKRHPMFDGKEATFWHIIQEGSHEDERVPDLRRCERIRWPKPIIEAVISNRVYAWIAERKGEPRVHIALEDFSYLVVLADRGEYILLWTAFFVEYPHQREKKKREWATSKKLVPPPTGTAP